jgi:hypothetical protein
MMPEVVEVHVFGIKAMRTAGGAEEPGILFFAGEEVIDCVHDSTHLAKLTQK